MNRRHIPARVRLVEWAWRLSPLTPRDLRLALTVPGQVNPRECQLLHRLAATTPPSDGAIVEIGSYRGRSAVALALGARAQSSTRAGARNHARAGGQGRSADTPLVHTVDPHRAFRGVMGGVYGPADALALGESLRRCGVAGAVRRWRMSSLAAARSWRGPIGLLWIDGDHRHEAVAADVAAWTPYLSAWGRLALHDARRPGLGPTREVARRVATGEWIIEGGVGDIVVLRRAAQGERSTAPSPAATGSASIPGGR